MTRDSEPTCAPGVVAGPEAQTTRGAVRRRSRGGKQCQSPSQMWSSVGTPDRSSARWVSTTSLRSNDRVPLRSSVGGNPASISGEWSGVTLDSHHHAQRVRLDQTACFGTTDDERIAVKVDQHPTDAPTSRAPCGARPSRPGTCRPPTGTRSRTKIGPARTSAVIGHPWRAITLQPPQGSRLSAGESRSQNGPMSTTPSASSISPLRSGLRSAAMSRGWERPGTRYRADVTRYGH